MRKVKTLLALVVGASLIGAGALAQDQKDIDKPLVVLSGGVFDLGGKSRAEGRVEIRSGEALFWKIKPFVGAMGTGGGAAYGFGGLLADFPLGEGFVLTPSFAAGPYRQGGGKDLGHGAEFRSQIELAYVIQGGSRLGLGASHISNASLGNRNPGANSLFAFFALPF